LVGPAAVHNTHTTQLGSNNMTTAAVKDNKVVVEIERLGFGFTEEAQYELAGLSVDRRVQVRESKHYAPKETVDQFAVQMGETVFPPIVVTSDGWIVDGNTRVGARIQRNEKFTPALVLNVNYVGAGERKQDLLHLLAATLNAQGGVRLTRAESRDVVIRLIRLELTTDNIARAIGMRAADVSAVKREQDAIDKLAKVGLSAQGVPATVLRALGSSKVADIHDVPFKELAELSMDAGFNAKEVNDAAKAIKATSSDEESLEVLKGLRTENGDRIVQKRLHGTGKPPMSQIARMRLTWLDRYAGREQELLETDPAVAPKHIEALESAIRVLSEVVRQQKG
jgi:hypothetical protein